MNHFKVLRTLLKTECPLVMPDAYDALSASLIETAGFKAVQCSGYSMALATGCKTENNLSIERNLQITQDIVHSVSIPVMADGEDGYGSPEKVISTVRAFADVGVSGINLEDQELRSHGPKCVVDAGLMVEKLMAARQTAEDCNVPDLVINARTDALAVAVDRKSGLRDSIARATRYLEVGADLVFVTSVTTLEEAHILIKEIPGPLSIAIGLPYNLMSLSIGNLRNSGVARISLPFLAIFSARYAIAQTLKHIAEYDDFSSITDRFPPP